MPHLKAGGRGERVVLGLRPRWDSDVVYVARVPGCQRIMTVAINVFGTRFPAYATSMGRVLLAGLPGRRADRGRTWLGARLDRAHGHGP